MPYNALLVVVLLAFSSGLVADTGRVGRIYYPYVNPLEREFELQVLSAQDDTLKEDHIDAIKLGYGQSFGDQWYGETMLSFERVVSDSWRLASIELEGLYQLTEQGEYDSDYGLLFELEYNRDLEYYEAATALVVAHDWGRYSGAANLALKYEAGEYIQSELETSLALQGRYRWMREFEPGIEWHKAQNLNALGAVAQGRVGVSWQWFVGLYGGLDDTSPSVSVNTYLEYEF